MTQNYSSPCAPSTESSAAAHSAPSGPPSVTWIQVGTSVTSAPKAASPSLPSDALPCAKCGSQPLQLRSQSHPELVRLVCPNRRGRGRPLAGSQKCPVLRQFLLPGSAVRAWNKLQLHGEGGYARLSQGGERCRRCGLLLPCFAVHDASEFILANAGRWPSP